MTKYNARYVAIETLRQLGLSNTPLPILYQQVCSRHQLGNRDRALTMNIIYGVLRNKQYLEVLMTNLCQMPLKKLHPVVYNSLAVGLYQLFFLSRIPESAAVNETVNGAKAAKLPKRLHGFINGVLRQSLRQKAELPQPEDQINKDAPILNHPEWMTARWSVNFGIREMQAICQANNRQQDLTLRINSQKTSPREYLERLSSLAIQADRGRYAPSAVTLPDYQGPISELPGHSGGLFQVQGESAQLASLLLQPISSNGIYLDGCAGLGGKTGHLLELMCAHEANLVAVEPEQHRQEKLLENLKHFDSGNRLSLFRGSMQDYCLNNPPQFQGVLIDAPCSGTGITGKQPDIRWRRKPKDITRYAALQNELLTLAARLLVPGGVLVYATCSLEPEENEGVVQNFLHSNPLFHLTDCSPYLPDEAAELVRDKCFQPRPSQLIDGFFAARLVRNNADD